jgi:hypothetical protein
LKPNFKTMKPIEIASYVCEELLKIDVKTTLSGGFCVEVYSFGEYTSMDIDLIDQSINKHNEIKKKMEELGFKQEGKNFRHADTAYTVEFPSSPLAIGQELIREEDIAEIETEYGVLRIITPTDSVKDRLAAYYHWKDERSLEQAILIASKHNVDFESIKNWSLLEDSKDKFELFIKRFKAR